LSRHPAYLSTPPAPPTTYTLSLHDALPISQLFLHSIEDLFDLGGIGDIALQTECPAAGLGDFPHQGVRRRLAAAVDKRHLGSLRSEEHTSELQSRENLVCRLLLEKKKKHHR